MKIEAITARITAAAIRQCHALDEMQAIKRETAQPCERQKDDDYPGESAKCDAAPADEEKPLWATLPEDRWCDRCKRFKANRGRFNAAKRELLAARRAMMTAWKASKLEPEAPSGAGGTT